jgi:rifampicin phosphotransferase
MDQLIVALDALDRSQLADAGGKAVNLGELMRAGLPVPAGVCLTTAAYARVAEAAHLATLLDEVSKAQPEQLAALAAQIRTKLEQAPVPQDIADEVHAAVGELGEAVPLAVRSSATAEDLPFASFAGQQDTYLGIVGAAAALDAVRRCWASLWTERAVVYRANQGIDQRGVKLAVVIQRLVDAAVAGVLFTANPLTGRRGEAVVEAHPGLGEAVVSGAVNPDHWRVDPLSGRVLEGPPDGSLNKTQLLTLGRLGQHVEAVFDTPQDIEFAFDGAGKAWLVQARAITTLYPLPATAPRDQRDLRVYLSFNVAQGVFQPITPMGIDAFRLLSISLASALGVRRTTSVLAEAGGRLFVDLTPALRSPLWRRIVRTALGQGEARSAALIECLLLDPRLEVKSVGRRRMLAPLVRALWRSRIPLRAAGAVIAPRRAADSIARLRKAVEGAGATSPTASAQAAVDAAEQLLTTWPARILPRLVPLMFGGLGSFALAERLLGDLATPDERDSVRRALPHNPTTEMDLALWALSRRVRNDAAARDALRARPAHELAAAYAAGSLPPVLQRGLAEFMMHYGHRAIAEIDLGVPRWSDDPAPLLGNLANYQRIGDGPHSPEAQFRAAAQQAERTVADLTRRAAMRGRVRALAVGFLLRRGRALAGFREMPKFLVVLLLARVRALMLSVGRDLAAAGGLDAADHVFFLTFPEVRAALAGMPVRACVAQRQARHAEEMRRRHVPRLLLSDGTEPTLEVEETGGDLLRGAAASAGRVTGRARVILEPAGAYLEPGDILVAPSTDPGWTPLFLSAAGLVMEMGGAMSHGAVVAREYGIPAVVGVPAASERIQDGQQITVDGSAGTVALSG